MVSLVSAARIKCRPVLLGPTIIPRDRLLRLLASGLEHGTAVIHGGAGYGKTTLLSSFAQSQNAPIIWCTFDEGDKDAAVLLDSLGAALYQALPEMSQEYLVALGGLRNIERDWRRMITLLVQELESAPAHLFILDDLHVLEPNSCSAQILDTLFRYLPEHTRLLLASRHVLRTRWLVRQRAQGSITEISREELRFTAAEVQTLAQDHFGLELTGVEVEALLEQTQGWPISVALTLRAWQRGHLTRSGVAGSREEILDYLALEVLDMQEPDRQEFLLATSILAQLTPSLCDAVVGQTGSLQMLTYLEEEGTFVTALGERTYTYHPQFRELLARTLVRERSAELIAGLHRRAAQFYAGQNEWGEAVAHYAHAADFAAAVEIVRQQGAALIRRGQQETLARWLSLVPERVRQDDPTLLRYQSELALLRRDAETARPLLIRARELAQQRGDAANAALSLALLGRAYQVSQEHPVTDRLMKEAFVEMDAAGVDDLEARLIYAFIRVELGETMRRATWATEAVLERVRRAGDVYVEARTLASLAALYFHLGRMEACHRAVNRVRQLQAEHGLGWQLLIQVANIEGYAFWAEGRPEQALRVLQEGEQVDPQGFYPTFRGWLLLTTANVLRDMEDPRAEEYYLRSLEQAGQSRTDRAEVLWEMGWWAFSRGKLARAREMAEEARSLADNQPALYLCVLQGALERAAGRFDAAEQFFHRALRKVGHVSFLYSVLLQRAGNRRRMGNEAGAWRDLRAAFNIGQRCGLAGGYFWLPDLVAELCAWALTRGLYAGYVQRLATTSLSSRYSGHFLPLLYHPNAEVRRQAATVLGELGGTQALSALRLALADPVPLVAEAARRGTERIEQRVRVRICCLGGLELWREGEQVRQWDPRGKVGRRAVQNVLAYLLLQGPRGASREDLVALLWPRDLGRRAGATRVYGAINALRQVLEPGLEQPAQSRFVVLQNDRYRLETGREIWLDSAEFQDCLEAADRLREEKSHRQAVLAAYRQAVELYRGEYLRGAFAGANDGMIADDWESASQGLRQKLLTALIDMAHLLETTGNLEEAVACYQRALAQDPLMEEIHARLIRLYKKLGRTEEAHQQYLSCRRILREELGIEPGKRVRQAYKDE